jgi:hypothetical protein
VNLVQTANRVRRPYADESADAAAFFFRSGDGLIRTTSQVTPADSPIMQTMKIAIPMSPSTFATEVG